MITTFDVVTAGTFLAGGLFDRLSGECTADVHHDVKWNAVRVISTAEPSLTEPCDRRS